MNHPDFALPPGSTVGASVSEALTRISAAMDIVEPRAAGASGKRQSKVPLLVSPTAVLELTLPVKIVAAGNAREHWSQRAARVKSQRQHLHLCLMVALAQQCGHHPLAHWLPATVMLTRLGGKQMDAHENLPFSLKPSVDELSVWFGVDDSDPRVIWNYDQQPGSRHGIRVRIEKGG